MVIDTYSHDFDKLISTAQLKDDLREKLKDVSFQANWMTVSAWTEQARYEFRKNGNDAKAIFEAIVNNPDGVLIWIQQYW